MTFNVGDVGAARAAAAHRLAHDTPRTVTLDADDLTLLASALTAFRTHGGWKGGVQSMHERYDHEHAVDDLAEKLGVTLGRWESTEVVAVPKGDDRWMTLDNGSGEVVRSFGFTDRDSDEAWRDRVAEESARDANARAYPLED